MISYKKATVSDAGELARLRAIFLCESNENVSEETKQLLVKSNTAYLGNALADGSFISFVALDGDIIIATSGLSFFTIPPKVSSPNGKLGYLLNMYTLPEYRRQGIATKLLNLILDEAKRLGCEKVLLVATDMGKPLYEKIGFHDPGNFMSCRINR